MSHVKSIGLHVKCNTEAQSFQASLAFSQFFCILSVFFSGRDVHSFLITDCYQQNLPESYKKNLSRTHSSQQQQNKNEKVIVNLLHLKNLHEKLCNKKSAQITVLRMRLFFINYNIL